MFLLASMILALLSLRVANKAGHVGRIERVSAWVAIASAIVWIVSSGSLFLFADEISTLLANQAG